MALDLHLLGPITAERDGEPVALGGPRQRAVLARLVLAGGRMVTADRLIDDVWAGEPPASATNTLQTYVSLLRRALGAPELLRREGPGYVLDLADEAIDARRFERASARGRDALADDPARALGELDAALAEWRGPALAPVAHEPWAVAEATRLDELRLASAELRIDALLALGRHADAVPDLERELAEHPLRERLTAQLMVALYRCGRQADALRAFARTRERLADELGLDPTPELATIESAVLQQAEWLAPPAARIDGAAPTAPTARAAEQEPAAPPGPVAVTDPIAGPDGPHGLPPPPVPLPRAVARLRSGPFVGRTDPLAELLAQWRSSLGGHRRLVVLAGEPGVGKTRLAARFAADVHAAGAIMLWGRATPDAVVPYQPIVEALRAALRVVSAEARRRVAAGRPDLGLLLPDLASMVPGVAPPRPEPGTERYVLFEAVADAFEEESSRHPLVLVVDDLHWADEPSLRLLAYVLRHERPGRLLVVATLRSTADDRSPAVDELLADLRRDGLVTRLDLQGLDVDDVATLLAEDGRSDLVGSAASIRDATGGNPFFIGELAAHARGDVDPTAGEVPASVLDVLGQRLDRLGDACARALAAAAVVGPTVDLPLLAAVSGLDGEELLDATDVAVAARILVEDGPTGRLAFAHALVRQAVLQRLTAVRRAALHARVADALRQSDEPRPSELAHHLLAAGDLVPVTERVAAALDAAEAALQVLAHEDALGWVERAAAVAGDRHLPGLTARLHLLESASASAAGDRARATAAASASSLAAGADGDATGRAHAAEAAALSIAGVGFDFGAVDEELVALLQSALDDLPVEETALRVRLLLALSSAHAQSPDVERRRRWADQAVAAAATSSDPEVVAAAQLARRLAAWRPDALDERLDAGARAVEAARAVGHRRLEATALLFRVGDLLESGDVAATEAAFAEFRERVGELRQPVWTTYADFLDATFHLIRGEYATAERLSAAGLAAGIASHGTNAEQARGGQLFCLAWDRGELGAVVELVEAVVATTDLPIWRVGLAASLFEAGREDESRAVYDGLVGPGGVDLPFDALWSTAACLLVEIARAHLDPVGASVLRQALEPYVGRIATTGLGGACLGPISRYVGVAAHLTGDLDTADALLRRAEDQARALGAVPFVARALRDRARVLHDRCGPGDAGARDRAAAEARRLAEACGMVLRGLPTPT